MMIKGMQLLILIMVAAMLNMRKSQKSTILELFQFDCSVISCGGHGASRVDYGGVGDGVTLNTEAFKRAIDDLGMFESDGGGQLFVPAGKWLTETFNLTSHFTLYLHKDAVLLASQEKTKKNMWKRTDVSEITSAVVLLPEQGMSEKENETSSEVSPNVQQLLDAHPYFRDVIIPMSCIFAAILLSWSLLPRLFRRFHKYSVEGPGSLLSKTSLWRPVPYEQSFWGALENPTRCFITLMAFLQICETVAPNTIVSVYAMQTCRGTFVVSLVWFLRRWKTYVIARALATDGVDGAKRDQLLALDKILCVGLLFVGTMALAEAFGVAVQSVLTMGGIGGVATAFAAKDVLGNVLSGLSVQFSQPFSIGDTIKAGSVEGQVIEMGLTTTSLLTDEKFPVFVPNSLFSCQVIINKSRAKWRSMVHKIPLQIDDIDKISRISEDIKSMLRANTNVFLGKEAPYCFLSLIERSYAELTLGCNLKQLSLEADQDILLEVVRIIKRHGAALGSTRQDTMT